MSTTSQRFGQDYILNCRYMRYVRKIFYAVWLFQIIQNSSHFQKSPSQNEHNDIRDTDTKITQLHNFHSRRTNDWSVTYFLHGGFPAHLRGIFHRGFTLKASSINQLINQEKLPTSATSQKSRLTSGGAPSVCTGVHGVGSMLGSSPRGRGGVAIKMGVAGASGCSALVGVAQGEP